MFRSGKFRLRAAPGAVLLLLASAACDDGPTSSQAYAQDPLDPPAMASMPAPTPETVRGIEDLLGAWEASWNAGDANAFAATFAEDADFVNPLGGILSGREAIRQTHLFLFGGPFAGSAQAGEVRRIVSLTGSLAIVDLNVTLTGYAGLPPGLSETEPGVVATRTRWVARRNGDRWEILAQQLTSIAPGA
jgi:uncharacterized protein (TIGR02246 family)